MNLRRGQGDWIEGRRSWGLSLQRPQLVGVSGRQHGGNIVRPQFIFEGNDARDSLTLQLQSSAVHLPIAHAPRLNNASTTQYMGRLLLSRPPITALSNIFPPTAYDTYPCAPPLCRRRVTTTIITHIPCLQVRFPRTSTTRRLRRVTTTKYTRLHDEAGRGAAEPAAIGLVFVLPTDRRGRRAHARIDRQGEGSATA